MRQVGRSGERTESDSPSASGSLVAEAGFARLAARLLSRAFLSQVTGDQAAGGLAELPSALGTPTP